MKNFSTQKDRILQFIEYKGISKNKFYNETGISNGILDKKSGLSMDTVEKFYSTYPEINPEWLLTGQGEMLKEPTPEDKQSKLQKLKEIADTSTKKNNLIPFYEDVATIGGTSISADTSAVANTTTYIDAGDWFKGEVSAAIRHYGDSMVEYSNGCILALKTITNQRNIVWGHNYVVETDEIRVTKRLQTCPEDKNCIKAYSTNTETYPDGTLIHEPFKIHKEDIRKIFLVIGSIHKEYGTEAVFIRK